MNSVSLPSPRTLPAELDARGSLTAEDSSLALRAGFGRDTRASTVDSVQRVC